MTAEKAPVTIRRLSAPADHGAEVADDVRRGLSAIPKTLPSKYFYDARGSALFDDITRLPEYYITRSETEILERCAPTIMEQVQPAEIVELGSGYSVKTKLLIDAMRRVGSGETYVPIDISEDALAEALEHLANYYPWLAIDGLVGDFFNDLPKVPRRGRRLMTFLGSTIGNFVLDERFRFFTAIHGALEPGDALLLGIDLVKDIDIILAAYDDSAGVTAEFNRNILNVVNSELDGDIPVDDFEYVVRWNPELECVDMGLRARRDIVAHLGAIDLRVEFSEGEEVHNEVSCKFRSDTIGRELAAAGLEVIGWFEDTQRRTALVLASPRVG